METWNYYISLLRPNEKNVSADLQLKYMSKSKTHLVWEMNVKVHVNFQFSMIIELVNFWAYSFDSNSIFMTLEEYSIIFLKLCLAIRIHLYPKYMLVNSLTKIIVLLDCWQRKRNDPLSNEKIGRMNSNIY